MPNLESIAAQIASITAAVSATSTAVTSFVSGNYDVAETAYTSAQNILSGYSSSQSSSAAASYQDAASGAASYWDTALGQIIRGIDDAGNVVDQDLLGYYTGAASSYESAAQTTQAVLNEDLDSIAGFIATIGNFILAGLETAIAGVSDFVAPILLSVETLLSNLLDGLKAIPLIVEGFKKDLFNKLEGLLTIDDKVVDDFIEQYKKKL